MRIDLTGEVAAAAKSDLSARCVSLDNLLLTREAEGGPSRSHDYPCAKSCPGHSSRRSKAESDHTVRRERKALWPRGFMPSCLILGHVLNCGFPLRQHFY